MHVRLDASCEPESASSARAPVFFRRAPSLKLRLCLLITALIALIALVAGVFVVERARDDIRAEVRSAMNLTEHYLDAELDVLADHPETEARDGAPFHLDRLQGVRHIEVQFYDAQGRLREVSAAGSRHAPLAPRWFSALVRAASPPMPDARRPVQLGGTTLGTWVMHPDPAYETDEIWVISRGLLELLGAFFVLVNLLVWWAVARAMRPVEQILHALAEIERGNLRARLPVFALPELSRLGTGFNHMASALECSIEDNRRLTRRLIDAQEAERRRLARELHDELGQCIAAIHAEGAAIRGAEEVPVVVRESAAAIVELAGRIHALLRGMLRRLRPPALDELGLESALRTLVAEFSARHPRLHWMLRVAGTLDSVSDENAMTAYRAAQECLTNVVRHANASRVEIVAACGRASGRPRLELCVADDGRGFDANRAQGGYGLRGLRERVQALGGECRIDTAPGAGTRIRISLPMESIVA